MEEDIKSLSQLSFHLWFFWFVCLHLNPTGQLEYVNHDQ